MIFRIGDARLQENLAVPTPITICLLILVCSFGCSGRPNPTSRGLEQARVNSPKGDLDAVLLRQDAGGAAGGWEWNVYIVPKGKPVSARYHDVFYAGTLVSPKVSWNQEHLLGIHYDIADIHNFRNLWALDEINKIGANGEGDYLVEIRLAPSSPDFSLLTASGTFRQTSSITPH